LAAEVESTLAGGNAIEVELVEGAAGVFDVWADGELIFSKDAAGRFPEHAEILAKLGH